MGNPLQGEATFEALGQSWTLRFNNYAICEFEATANVALSSIAGDMRISYLRALVVSTCRYVRAGQILP
jgi:hypothetical protein